ncbi:hypothetical protein EBR21_00310 [bacterium]|nr:hypothetical protein [bacterium]
MLVRLARYSVPEWRNARLRHEMQQKQLRRSQFCSFSETDVHTIEIIEQIFAENEASNVQ